MFDTTRINKGESLILLPEVVTKEHLDFIIDELLNTIINLDVSKNAAKKMYLVNNIVEDINCKSTLMPKDYIYISDYQRDYEIYKRAKRIKHSINSTIDFINNNEDKAKWLCNHWATLLIANNQDICKDTISMILDVREGKNFYFISKK